MEERFGAVLTNSDGRIVLTRFIGEQHAKADCGSPIPSATDWLAQISPAAWMGPGSFKHDARVEAIDPVEGWRAEVATGRTVLSLQEWMKRQAELISSSLDLSKIRDKSIYTCDDCVWGCLSRNTYQIVRLLTLALQSNIYDLRALLSQVTEARETGTDP